MRKEEGNSIGENMENTNAQHVKAEQSDSIKFAHCEFFNQHVRAEQSKSIHLYEDLDKDLPTAHTNKDIEQKG